jgi:pimeloyl-ACP methyl ester carboxylesterase
MRRLVLALTLLATPALAADSGWHQLEVAETGQRVWQYVPYSVTEPAPAVVFLHGAGSTPEAWRFLLQPVAEAAGAVLLLPKSESDLGWGPGRDRETVLGALELAAEAVALDPFRISVAGHSSGGAYAMVLTYASRSRFAGVLALGAPYRTILEVADPAYTAPLRLVYGDQDPNYYGPAFAALAEMLERLGAPWTLEILPGSGHGDVSAEALASGFTFLLEQRYPGLCVTSRQALCLQEGRFRVTGTWATASGSGPARTVPGESRDAGLFWFFGPDNWEVQVKVLRGCLINQHYWVFLAASTDVEYTITVEDLEAGMSREYGNALGEAARAIRDVQAFGCTTAAGR